MQAQPGVRHGQLCRHSQGLGMVSCVGIARVRHGQLCRHSQGLGMVSCVGRESEVSELSEFVEQFVSW